MNICVISGSYISGAEYVGEFEDVLKTQGFSDRTFPRTRT